jgi:hypothetical protein
VINFISAQQAFMAALGHLASPPKGVPLADWPAFSKALAGLRPNELTLLCAPTGAGKTALMASMSAQLIRQGVPHFAAPVETGEVDYACRVLSAIASKDLNNGEAVPVELLNKVAKENEQLLLSAKMNISTYDGRVDVDEMITNIKFQIEHGAQIAILDNLNFFLKVTRSQDQLIEMDEAIRHFVTLAKKLPIHIILIVHPKKTEGGRIESEFDIKGPSTFVQEASNVILFNRPKPQDIEQGYRDHDDREMVFKKIRKRGHYVNIPIYFSYKSGRYTEIKQSVRV